MGGGADTLTPQLHLCKFVASQFIYIGFKRRPLDDQGIMFVFFSSVLEASSQAALTELNALGLGFSGEISWYSEHVDICFAYSVHSVMKTKGLFI